MRVVVAILFTCITVFGQSNLFWQIRTNLWPLTEQISFPGDEEFSIYEFNDSTWYLFTGNSNPRISFNKLLSTAAFGDRLLNGPDFARINDSLFVSLEDKIFCIKMPSYFVEAVSDFHVNRLLQINENLVFGLTPDFKIYKSVDNLRHWEFVRDFEEIVSWVYDGNETIYYTTPYNKLKKADFQFNSTILHLGSSQTVKIGNKLISPGKDTLLFLSDRDLWKTTNGGTTFEKSAINLDLMSNLLFYDRGNIITLANKGIRLSSDFGETWVHYFRDDILNIGYEPFLYCNQGIIILKYFTTEHAYDVMYDPDYVVPEYEDFFPLHVGNKWRYGRLVSVTGTRLIEVTDEQIIDGKTWYTIAGITNPVRYEDHVLYSHDGTNSHVEIDFRFNPGNPINTGYFIDGTMMWSAKKIFAGKTYDLKGPFRHRVNIDEQEMYAPGFGPMVINRGHEIGYGGYEDYYQKVFEAEVYQDGEMKYFSEVGTPSIEQLDLQFIYYPVDFELKLRVRHPNSYYSHNKKISFIKSVKVEYYYEKEGNNTPHAFHEVPLVSDIFNYGGVFGLDEQYLNDGYKFRFRYVVEDASFKNNKTYLPASGYYQYDGTTLGLDDEIYSFQLNQNYPNPFNPVTKLTYSLEKPSHVVFEVFDIQGRKVSELVEAHQPAGNYTREFDGSNLASGVYFGRFTATTDAGNVFNKSIKMIVMK